MMMMMMMMMMVIIIIIIIIIIVRVGHEYDCMHFTVPHIPPPSKLACCHVRGSIYKQNIQHELMTYSNN